MRLRSCSSGSRGSTPSWSVTTRPTAGRPRTPRPPAGPARESRSTRSRTVPRRSAGASAGQHGAGAGSGWAAGRAGGPGSAPAVPGRAGGRGGWRPGGRGGVRGRRRQDGRDHLAHAVDGGEQASTAAGVAGSPRRSPSRTPPWRGRPAGVGQADHRGGTLQGVWPRGTPRRAALVSPLRSSSSSSSLRVASRPSAPRRTWPGSAPLAGDLHLISIPGVELGHQGQRVQHHRDPLPGGVGANRPPGPGRADQPGQLGRLGHPGHGQPSRPVGGLDHDRERAGGRRLEAEQGAGVEQGNDLPADVEQPPDRRRGHRHVGDDRAGDDLLEGHRRQRVPVRPTGSRIARSRRLSVVRRRVGGVLQVGGQRGQLAAEAAICWAVAETARSSWRSAPW